MSPVRFSVDALGTGTSCHVTGWAFHDDVSICKLGLTLAGGELVACRYGLSRPDVAAAFKDSENAARSGFIVHGLRGEGELSLVAELADGRTMVEPLGHIDRQKFHPGTRHFSGAVTALRQRPGFDFPYLEAILRVCAAQPRPLPSLDRPALLIAPVYGGLPFLRPFFDSLFRNTTAPYRLAVVDDGNTDPAVRNILAEVATRDGTTLIRQERNGGFVEAVTAGFSLWRGEHVVLVNTDTVLPPGWLERLVAPLERTPTIASATPFTNCGSICGFPHMPEDNPLYLGLGVERIDAAFRRLDGGALLLPIPTGVGFCMGMSSHALVRIGFVERETFGAGYGEENDWCRKAVAAGFTNVLVPDLFVHHAHGGSFPSEQKQRQIARNLAIINQRYPDYPGEVAELVLADPLYELRAFLAFLLAAETHPEGGLLAVQGEIDDRTIRTAIDVARACGRPVLLANLATAALPWTYTFLWPEGRFQVAGGNLAELGGLVRGLKFGDLVVGELSECWSPEAVKRALANLPICDNPTVDRAVGLRQ